MTAASSILSKSKRKFGKHLSSLSIDASRAVITKHLYRALLSEKAHFVAISLSHHLLRPIIVNLQTSLLLFSSDKSVKSNQFQFRCIRGSCVGLNSLQGPCIRKIGAKQVRNFCERKALSKPNYPGAVDVMEL